MFKPNVHSSFVVYLVPKNLNCLNYLFLFLILSTYLLVYDLIYQVFFFVFNIIIPSYDFKIRLIFRTLFLSNWEHFLSQNLRTWIRQGGAKVLSPHFSLKMLKKLKWVTVSKTGYDPKRNMSWNVVNCCFKIGICSKMKSRYHQKPILTHYY